MRNFIFRRIAQLRQNYWFWPSAMTVGAVVLGFLLPFLDTKAGSDWIRNVGFIRATEVDGARAILTTLATATLGVAGVAFSVTIVAVSFASSNYGPRLIGNFMADRKNQIILGIFVATFVYCITVLISVHESTDSDQSTLDAFVPQLSVFFALLLTLTAVAALIAYIHHIPESINIMNLAAEIGDKLQRAITRMLDEEGERDQDAEDAVDIKAWRQVPQGKDAQIVRAKTAGFVQQFDVKGLAKIARETDTQITVHRAVGDFIVEGEAIMSAGMGSDGVEPIAERMRDCYTQGANRTDAQDVLFLSDQLGEVLGRALSPGVNDPQTAVLCLNWLRAGLVVFASRAPSRQERRSDPVLYRRVTFEDMLDRSFNEMRQYVATDRTATLHALRVLESAALAACREAMVIACVKQMRALAASAQELLRESIARDEVQAELNRALTTIAARKTEQRA
jgi:uncharacterized membrane protein